MQKRHIIDAMNASLIAAKQAIQHAGGVGALASALGTKHYNVSKWSRNRVPAKYVLRVEELTGISRHDLRPDIFGPQPQQAA